MPRDNERQPFFVPGMYYEDGNGRMFYSSDGFTLERVSDDTSESSGGIDRRAVLLVLGSVGLTLCGVGVYAAKDLSETIKPGFKLPEFKSASDGIYLDITAEGMRDSEEEMNTVIARMPPEKNQLGELKYSLARRGSLLAVFAAYNRALTNNNNINTTTINTLFNSQGIFENGYNVNLNKAAKALNLTGLKNSDDYHNIPVDEKGLKFINTHLELGIPVFVELDEDIGYQNRYSYYGLINGVSRENNITYYTYLDPLSGQTVKIQESAFKIKAYRMFAFDQNVAHATLSGFISSLVEFIPRNYSVKPVTLVPPIDIPKPASGWDSLCGNFPQEITKWEDLIIKYSKMYNLRPELLAAIMVQESGGNPVIMSDSGAVGLMQVMPRDGIAAGFMCKNGPCFGDRPTISKLKDPDTNVEFAARYLASLIHTYGTEREALLHYGPSDMGYRYADIVLGHVNTYAGSCK